MSFDAIRWALDQPVSSALTKFLLVAMADCVNSESQEMLCWSSYARLARRTGMNTKTVETAVSRLKREGFIVDTGRRAGDTGKVVVYRLNTSESGGIQPGPQATSAIGTRPPNTTECGAIGNPPKFDGNPPKFGGQSPQKAGETTPKTGGRSRNGIRKGTRKEADAALAVLDIDGVPPPLLADWLAVRRDKRAGTLTQTAVDGLLREAGKAGITPAEAVRFCCEANWVGFNSGWYADRVGKGQAIEQSKQESFV